MEWKSDQCVAIFDFFTHTIGSNSTATLGPSVIELITFAALSWTVIVSVVILAVLLWCVFHESKLLSVCLHKRYDLEVSSQATKNNLVLFQPWTGCVKY